MKCVSKGYNSIYFDTKHLDSKQKYFGEFKKQKRTCYSSGTRSPTKYVRKCSNSSEQADEVNSDISHLDVKSSRPFTESNFYKKKCSLAVSQKLFCASCAKTLETVTIMMTQRRVVNI